MKTKATKYVTVTIPSHLEKKVVRHLKVYHPRAYSKSLGRTLGTTHSLIEVSRSLKGVVEAYAACHADMQQFDLDPVDQQTTTPPATAGAACPHHGCEHRWFWDWCSDTYVDETGKPCIDTVPGASKDSTLLDDVQILVHMCHCGKILGFNVGDEDGGTEYNHPDWATIDWELEQYSSPDCGCRPEDFEEGPCDDPPHPVFSSPEVENMLGVPFTVGQKVQVMRVPDHWESSEIVPRRLLGQCGIVVELLHRDQMCLVRFDVPVWGTDHDCNVEWSALRPADHPVKAGDRVSVFKVPEMIDQADAGSLLLHKMVGRVGTVLEVCDGDTMCDIRFDLPLPCSDESVEHVCSVEWGVLELTKAPQTYEESLHRHDLLAYPTATDLSERDQQMIGKGYKYRLTPIDNSWEPIYSKTLAGVIDLMRDYRTTRFDIKKMGE